MRKRFEVVSDGVETPFELLTRNLDIRVKAPPPKTVNGQVTIWKMLLVDSHKVNSLRAVVDLSKLHGITSLRGMEHVPTAGIDS